MLCRCIGENQYQIMLTGQLHVAQHYSGKILDILSIELWVSWTPSLDMATHGSKFQSQFYISTNLNMNNLIFNN
jgi:hypothetical protein